MWRESEICRCRDTVSHGGLCVEGCTREEELEEPGARACPQAAGAGARIGVIAGATTIVSPEWQRLHGYPPLKICQRCACRMHDRMQICWLYAT